MAVNQYRTKDNKRSATIGTVATLRLRRVLFEDLGHRRKKFKLKKKFRYWRAFKYRFLFKSRYKKLMFFRLDKWTFRNQLIWWKQMELIFFRKKKQWFPKKNKYIFGLKFYRVLSLFELRLDILALRVYLVKHIKVAWSLISLGQLLVNNFSYTKFYVLKPGDIVQRVYAKPIFNRYLYKSINFLKTFLMYKSKDICTITLKSNDHSTGIPYTLLCLKQAVRKLSSRKRVSIFLGKKKPRVKPIKRNPFRQ